MTKNVKLGVFDCTMIVVSLVIGMGIFRTPANVARQVPDAFLFFFTWIVGGVIALCGALTYAEIGSRYPVTGGYYKIFSSAYHPSIAFAINCIILISNAASLSGVALIGSEYISQVVFSTEPSSFVKSLIAMSAIIAFYGVNMMGLRISSKVLNVLMMIKIGMLIIIIAALFFPQLYHAQNQVYSVSNTGFWG